MRRTTFIPLALIPWSLCSSLASCADPLVEEAHRVFPLSPPSALVFGEGRDLASEDDVLERELLHRLGRIEGAEEREVDVRVNGGIVVLKGEADHLLARRAVELAVAHTPGVRAIVNGIVIVEAGRDDAEIARDVVVAVAAVDGAESFDVDAESEDGVVVLQGRISSYLERLLVERAAMSVPGVVAVDDQLDLVRTGKRSDEEILEEIQAALELDERLGGHALQVHVDNRTVSMSGSVPTTKAQQLTLALATAAGAHDVDLVGVKVEGVDVHDPTDPGDEVLASAVATALDAVPVETTVVVEVDRGLAELTGTVLHDAARRAATHAAESVVGLRGVLNRLEIAETDGRGELQRSAEATMKRMKPRGSPTVQVVDDVAHLSGTMMSHYERDSLVRELEAIDGIALVNDDDLVLRSPSELGTAD